VLNVVTNFIQPQHITPAHSTSTIHGLFAPHKKIKSSIYLWLNCQF